MPIIDNPGWVKLLLDLPYPERHCCFKGEIFDGIRSFKDDEIQGSIGEEKVFFTSKAKDNNNLVSAINDKTINEFEYIDNPPPKGEKETK